jgi:hypothetical protein
MATRERIPGAGNHGQMFALAAEPPRELALAGVRWRLERVFKHDFFAATCLYAAEPGRPEDLPGRIVVKFGRRQAFWGLPMQWLGRLLRDHERAIYRAIEGVPGVPMWVGEVGPAGLAIEYLSAKPLDHFAQPPAGYFDTAERLLREIHRRGVAYVDANKRSNFLVGSDGAARLVDFQISVRELHRGPAWLRRLWAARIRYLQAKDLYHLFKHKRRLAPAELTEEQDVISRRRGGLHALHRRLTKPYRNLRRRLLGGLSRSGRLRSPTGKLEDHHQPEKATWRAPDEAERP